MPDQPPVKSVKTAFEITETLLEIGGGGVIELAELLEIPKSTIHDHLRTLEQIGYLVNENGRYNVSTKFLEIGGKRRNNLPIYKVSKPEVRKIAQQTGEHAGLMIEENGVGVLLFTTASENTDPLPIAEFGGIRIPLHATAPCKAILANLEESRIESIIEAQGLRKFTEHTITEREQLLQEIEEIREQGYAVSRRERLDANILGIAAPILDQNQRSQGALSIYGPLGRINNQSLIDEYSNIVMRASSIVEVNLNYS